MQRNLSMITHNIRIMTDYTKYLDKTEAQKVWQDEFIERYAKLSKEWKSREKSEFWRDLVQYKDITGRQFLKHHIQKIMGSNGSVDYWFKKYR